MKKNNKIGIILILVGIFILVNNFNLMRGEAVLYFVSLGFFIGYFSNKKANIGLLIPACIVLAVGVYSTTETFFNRLNLDSSSFLLLLGSAFLAIYLIHNIRLKTIDASMVKWPGIVAICLYVFSIFVLFQEKLRFSIPPILSKLFWPLLLILVGVITIFNSGKKSE